MTGFPPVNEIPDVVKIILAFMADIEEAKKVVAAMQANNTNNVGVNVKGDPTKQGRYALQIEGNIPKGYAIKILQIIDELEGSIEVVAG